MFPAIRSQEMAIGSRLALLLQIPFYRRQCRSGMRAGAPTEQHRGEDSLVTIQEEVLETFYARLGASDAVSDRMLAKLKNMFSPRSKPKADDFAAVFDEESEGELS